jgi:hypothetical protein
MTCNGVQHGPPEVKPCGNTWSSRTGKLTNDTTAMITMMPMTSARLTLVLLVEEVVESRTLQSMRENEMLIRNAYFCIIEIHFSQIANVIAALLRYGSFRLASGVVDLHPSGRS